MPIVEMSTPPTRKSPLLDRPEQRFPLRLDVKIRNPGLDHYTVIRALADPRSELHRDVRQVIEATA